MPDRGNSLIGPGLFALLTLLLLAGSAKAYVDPGAGPEFIGYFMSLVTWLGVAFTGVLLWPIFALIRRFRRGYVEAFGAPLPDPVVSPDDDFQPEAQALLADSLGLALLVVSMHDEALYAGRVLRAGGRGYRRLVRSGTGRSFVGL